MKMDADVRRMANHRIKKCLEKFIEAERLLGKAVRFGSENTQQHFSFHKYSGKHVFFRSSKSYARSYKRMAAKATSIAERYYDSAMFWVSLSINH